MSIVVEEKQPASALDKQEKPLRKRRRVIGEKVCGVCGDKALAHHFGALACETCKAFFRRNALSKEQRKCLFKGDCPIDVKTRRFCSACRLAKCFSVGMQADLILDEEEKKQRVLKMTEKKCKKEQCKFSLEPGGASSLVSLRQSPTCAVSTTGGEVSCSPEHASSGVEQVWLAAASSESSAVELQVVGNPASLHMDSARWSQQSLPEEVGQSMEVMLSSVEGLVMGQDFKNSACGRESIIHQPPPPPSEFSYPPTPSTSGCGSAYAPDAWPSTAPPPPDANTPPHPHTPLELDTAKYTSLSSGPLMIHPDMVSTFKHVSREELPSDPYMYWRLSEEERSLLSQLSAAYQDTVLSVLQGSPPRETVRGLTHELYLQECELEAGQAVSFAKRMEDFRQLRLDEQIALLKASTCQTLGIRSCALYVSEKDAWLTHRGYFTLAQCLELIPNHPHIAASLKLCRTIKSIVKNDVTLYALLHCFVLFDPSDERIIDRQLINSIRDKYIILLRHYLESIYSYLHSDKYMMALQENLVSYRSLCQEGKPLIKKFFPSIPNKLLIEVLDLD